MHFTCARARLLCFYSPAARRLSLPTSSRRSRPCAMRRVAPHLRQVSRRALDTRAERDVDRTALTSSARRAAAGDPFPLKTTKIQWYAGGWTRARGTARLTRQAGHGYSSSSSPPLSARADTLLTPPPSPACARALRRNARYAADRRAAPAGSSSSAAAL